MRCLGTGIRGIRTAVRLYEYRILNRTFRMPNRRFDTYFYHHPLMWRRCSRQHPIWSENMILRAFVRSGAQVKTTVRTIYACDVTTDGAIITIRVCGNGFLYNMVRIIAGTLVKVGGGELEPEKIKIFWNRRTAVRQALRHRHMVLR